MPTAVFVWVHTEQQFAVRFIRLDPAFDGAANRRVIVVYPAVDDADTYTRAGAVTPGGLRAQNLGPPGRQHSGGRVERPGRANRNHEPTGALSGAPARLCICARRSATSARFTLSVGVSGNVSPGHSVWRRICWCGARRWLALRTISAPVPSAPLTSSKTACTS